MKLSKLIKSIYILFFVIFITLLIITPELVSENSKIAIYKKDPNKIYFKNIKELPKRPTNQNPLGVDKIGRDIMARLIIATRNSILLSFTYSTSSAIIGFFIGTIIACLRFKACMLISKFIEVLEIIPFFYIIMLIFSQILKREDYNILETSILLSLIHGWIRFCFIARNNTIKIKNLDYIKASETMGSSKIRTIIYHIFPEVFSRISSIIPLEIAKSFTTFEVISLFQRDKRNLYPSIGELLGYMEMGNEYLWIWINPLIILTIINIILVIISSKFKKKMKHLILS